MSPRLVVTVAVAALAAVGLGLAPTLTRSVRPEPAPAPIADEGVHAAVTVDRDAVLADGDRRFTLRVELTADGEVRGVHVPTDLLVVLDRSGSMGGDKLVDAQRAALALRDHLGSGDDLALITFASDVRVDVPMGASDPRAFERAVHHLEAGGSTSMGAALAVAVDTLPDPVPGRARRVVLVSDGLPDDVAGLAGNARTLAQREAPLTTVGIGEDYDEAVLQTLADLGTGNFHWARPGTPLQEVLADELLTARETAASQVTVRLTGAPVVFAGGLPIEDGAVPLGAMFAGQRRVVWLTVEVPEGVAAAFDPGDLELSWRDVQGGDHHVFADVPGVSLTTEVQRFAAALGDRWAEQVVGNEYNEARCAASDAVQRGERAEADAILATYLDRNRRLNALANHGAVADNLEEAERLRREVADRFDRGDAAELAAFAKETRMDAYLGARGGAARPTAP